MFSNGIIALAGVASLLIIGFGGQTSALIPLYAVGVFCGFTLVPARHGRPPQAAAGARLEAEPGHQHDRRRSPPSSCLIVVVVSKFSHGAWIPVVLIPLIVLGFRKIKRHYDHVASSLKAEPTERVARHSHTVVVLIGSVNKGVLNAIAYARSMRPDRLVAISVVTDAEEEARRGRRLGTVRTAGRAAHRLLARIAT